MLSTFSNSPREDSEAEEDLLTLNARSESLSSGLLFWEVVGDAEGGLDCSVPMSQRCIHFNTYLDNRDTVPLKGVV